MTYGYDSKIDPNQDSQWDPKVCLKTPYSKTSYYRETSYWFEQTGQGMFQKGYLCGKI